MTNFDFGEARRQRSVNTAPKSMIITDDDGEVEAEFLLVAEIPAQFFDRGASGQLAAALEILFVRQSDAEEFLDRYKPSFEDIGSIVEGLYESKIGRTLGEALASGV
jgi:hypothetical protein